jgi:predicted acetyltransferase
MVATAASYAFTLTVCGSTVPMAGLTMVTVRATHRRRGILRRLIAAHLADAEAHSEPVSGLWASEGGIYGRFGYGVAAEAEELTVAADPGLATAGGDEPVALDVQEAARVLPEVFARALVVRPGSFARSEPWWRTRRLADRAELRRDRSTRRFIVVRRDGVAVGYVAYRLHAVFTEGRPSGTVDVEELIALDGRAEASLWRYVTGVDLYPRVTYWNAPLDSALPWLASDRRRVTRRGRPDTLWLRIGEVGAALAARRYLADDRLTLAVRDPLTEVSTRWALTVVDGRAVCEATESVPDLELDRAALGSIYLGGVPPSTLARAGAIRGEAAAVARADALFRWSVAPWCPEVF